MLPLPKHPNPVTKVSGLLPRIDSRNAGDPDTLALVSETLQGLRVGGRVVGIITHIPELRDEFAQRVIVTKRQGFSTVEVRGLAETAWFAPRDKYNAGSRPPGLFRVRPARAIRLHDPG